MISFEKLAVGVAMLAGTDCQLTAIRELDHNLMS